MTNNNSDQTKEVHNSIIRITIFISIFLVLFILTISLLNFYPEFKGSINWKSLNEANLGGEIAILFFISLAIQSSIEIFVSNFREVDKNKLQLKQEAQYDKNNKEEESATKLIEYRNQTKKITNFAGLIIGFGVGLSGVRVLQPFVQELNLVKWQAILFHTIDILLVAGLLSGGSSGIHRITRIYNEFTDLAREKAKKR